MALKCSTVVLLVALYMVALHAGLPDRLPDGEVFRDTLLPPMIPKEWSATPRLQTDTYTVLNILYKRHFTTEENMITTKTGQTLTQTTQDDATPSFEFLRTRVADLQTLENAGVSEIVWRRLVRLINETEDQKLETAGSVMLGLSCVLGGLGLLLKISLKGLLQAMVALELDVDQDKMKGAGQTDSCTDAAATPVLTSKNSGSSKKTGRLSKRGHH
ncbi:uncharacterized protein LOC123482620 [Coregonus clupeaformis]|uniref:uncharacterized protein LOC123482620 n=1 Tax=Coregonus clupeaformis TaxID=59861 RepID=UPI001E1C8590|nr:uncharacterized protein LOC123482620 [Coregonus clupeaformis]